MPGTQLCPFAGDLEQGQELLVGGEKWTVWRDELSGKFYFHSEARGQTQWADPRLLGQAVCLHAANSSRVSSGASVNFLL